MPHEQLKKLLDQFEGRINHLYLDTATPAKVTGGVGHLIATPLDAMKLPFVLRNTPGDGPPVLATRQEIADEFARVSAAEPGKVASYYLQFCLLALPETLIDELLDSDIVSTEIQLTSGITAFAAYHTYPEPAQDGTLDMAFNLGVHGLRVKFPLLCAAIERKDWLVCAGQCHRNGVSEARNNAVKDMFLNAASL